MHPQTKPLNQNAATKDRVRPDRAAITPASLGGPRRLLDELVTAAGEVTMNC
jgi:hypothetical protein